MACTGRVRKLIASDKGDMIFELKKINQAEHVNTEANLPYFQ